MTASADALPPPRGGVLVEAAGTREPKGPCYEISSAILDYLYQAGFIERINERFDLLIDIYEEELVKPEMLPEIIAMLDEELARVRNSGKPALSVKPEAGRQSEIPRVDLEEALNRLKALMAEAARKQRGVWFIF